MLKENILGVGAPTGFPVMLDIKGHFFSGECPNNDLIPTIKYPSLDSPFREVP